MKERKGGKIREKQLKEGNKNGIKKRRKNKEKIIKEGSNGK